DILEKRFSNILNSQKFGDLMKSAGILQKCSYRSVRAFGYSADKVTPNTSKWEYTNSPALFFVRIVF
ncbi:MAG: hypothetical protein J6Q07_07720, partial [Alistipes sp.]|nr:hypothetical protein [Alistipes sp.]